MRLPIGASETIVQVTGGGFWLLVTLMFALGAALGSFLNVVAYRLPRGMSLSSPGSRCPACGKPIRWYDNVPIFGWLWLRGRCRDCKAPISPRYPLVELLAAVAAVLVTRSALVLDSPEIGESLGVDFPLLAFRMLLVYALLCAALVEFDGPFVPWKLLFATFVIGLVATLIWPDLRPAQQLEELADGRWVETGRLLAAAVLFGLLAWPLLMEDASGEGLRAGAARVAELALVGIFVGLVALVAIAVLAVVGLLAARTLARYWPAGRFGWAASLVLATLIWIAIAADAASRWPQVAHLDRPLWLVAAGAIVAGLSILGRAVLRKRAMLGPGRRA